MQENTIADLKEKQLGLDPSKNVRHHSRHPDNDRLVILIEVGDKRLNQKTLTVAARWKFKPSGGEWIGEATGKPLSLSDNTFWIECPIGA